MDSVKTSIRNQDLRNALFTLVILIFLLLPLRKGLPEAASSINPGGGPLTFSGLAKNLPDFPAAYTRLFNNNYWGLDLLISAYTRFRLVALGEKVFPTVLIGKENWMFWTGEGSIDDYQNTQPFLQSELENIQTGLDAIYEQYHAEGITFMVVVVPNKTTIYPEYLPETIQKLRPKSRLDVLMAHMQAYGKTPILDLRPTLLAEKKEHQVYFATDTHWNDFGALAASREILQALQPIFPALKPYNLDDFNWMPEQVEGDLPKLLFAADLFPEQTIRLEPRFERAARFVETGVEGRLLSIHPDQHLPKLVMFRDSFAIALIPFLSEHFSRAVYQWDFMIDEALVAEEMPDVVILEITERYLARLLPRP